MTKPRRHIPGQVAMVTRRCAQRRYFLRPDSYINNVLPFEVGKAANRYDQQVYGALAMSNHIHLELGDATGRRSDFMRDSMSAIANSRNRDLGREEHFWGSGPFNDTVLLDRDAIERKLIYIWTNPVRAGLVKRAEDWPGFKILPKDWGTKIRVDKPERFYGRRNPDVVEFTPQPPPGYDDMSLEEVREHFQNLLEEAEDKLNAALEEEKRHFAGVATVEAVDPMSQPSTEETKTRHIPRFASKDFELRSAARAIYRDFVDRYETCRQRWLNSRKKKHPKRVQFPAGTVQLRRCAPVQCDAPLDDEPGLFASP